MNHSFRIGALFGISIRVHVIFLALFALLLLQILVQDGVSMAIWFGVRFTLLFCFVLLHELGHSLAAQAHGIRVHDIVLWPLGGLARLAAIPEQPGVEFRIAIAGPLVNFFLVALLLPMHLATGGSLDFHPDEFMTWSALQYAMFVNLMMGSFNLLPAFPLDGGRIFRALLARKVSYLRATRAAVHVGRSFALVLGLISLVSLEYLSLTFIALFVWLVGAQELAHAEKRERQRRLGELRSDRTEVSPGALRFLELDDRGDATEKQLHAIERRLRADQELDGRVGSQPPE